MLDGKIERDEGIALIKRYDGEFPVNYYEEFLEYCEISDRDARGIVDSWRSDHLWKKDGKDCQSRSTGKLRHQDYFFRWP